MISLYCGGKGRKRGKKKGGCISSFAESLIQTRRGAKSRGPALSSASGGKKKKKKGPVFLGDPTKNIIRIHVYRKKGREERGPDLFRKPMGQERTIPSSSHSISEEEGKKEGCSPDQINLFYYKEAMNSSRRGPACPLFQI